MPTARARRHAPWSASKAQCALLCARLYHYKYVDKLKEPEEMPETRLGKAVHIAIEGALQGEPLEEACAKAGERLEGEIERRKYEVLCASIPAFLERIDRFRHRRNVHRTLVEFSLAIREDGTPTAFYSGDAYFRGIVDVGYLFDGDCLAVVDHKSGFRSKRQSIEEQLEGYAVLGAAQFRSVRRVWLGVHWVGDAQVEWAPPLRTAEIKGRLLPRLFDNIEAAALAVEDGPRPSPGAWCYRCSYRSVCPSGHDVRYEPVEEEPDPYL